MINSKKYFKEACVDSLEQALKAEQQGADRIELCSRLDLDGLTPANTLIEQSMKLLRIPVRVMIRPKGGTFIYSPSEIDEMLESIKLCKLYGVEGVVFGVLNSSNEVDLEVTNLLAESAAPMKVTFHKAFDLTPNPITAFSQLAGLKNIDAVLTSGQKRTAREGMALLRELISSGPEFPDVVVAGKVSIDNIESLHSTIAAKYYHGKKIVGDLGDH